MRAVTGAYRPVLLVCSALVAGSLVLAGCSSDDQATVRTSLVTTGEVQEVVQAAGTIQPRAQASVSAGATGTVATLEVTDGQDVTAGQVLLRIDSPQAQQQLEQAQAADARAAQSGGSRGTGDDAELRRRQAAADRDAEARFAAAEAQANTVVDPVAREQALTAVDSARTQYQLLQQQNKALLDQVTGGLEGIDAALSALSSAQRVQTRAAVAVAQAAVDSLTVTAPISGRVSLASGDAGGGSGLPAGASDLLSGSGITLPEGALDAAGGGESGADAPLLTTGSPVSAGSRLLTVVDASTLTLTADVDETDVLRVTPGTRANVTVDAVQGAEYTGTVTSVDPSPTSTSAGSVTYTARLSYDGGTLTDGAPAPAPLPGMSAVVSLVVAESDDALRVPAAALVRASDGSGDAVWVDESGVAKLRDVTVGIRGEDMVQVTEGLKAQDRVVTDGQDELSEGEQLP